MPTYLHIAGHGKKVNGSFDPGATGYIKQGEHRYYAEAFFNELKKHQPKGVSAIYHTAYNVFSYGNVVNLAKQYGKDTIVIEWHFDASSPAASGGHVIVYKGYSPDKLDLNIRDGIAQMVGVRYNHKGHSGISGRNNLANVNRAANGGINYRLVELGFGTNENDSNTMLNKMSEFARVMSEKIYNVSVAPVEKDSAAGYHVVKSGDTLWGIATANGVSVEDLKAWNKLTSNVIVPGQSLEVKGSDTPAPAPAPKPKEDPPASTGGKLKVGDWVRVPAKKLYGTGMAASPTNSKELSAQIDKIDNSWKNPIRLIKNGAYQGFVRPSDITGGKTEAATPKPSKSYKDVAKEIHNGVGGWGNMPERKTRVEKAGFDYEAVRAEVNRLSGITAQPSNSIKVGDVVTASKLYASASSTKNVRSSPITGYVSDYDKNGSKGWKNKIRLQNKKGGYYIGYTKPSDLI